MHIYDSYMLNHGNEIQFFYLNLCCKRCNIIYCTSVKHTINNKVHNNYLMYIIS